MSKPPDWRELITDQGVAADQLDTSVPNWWDIPHYDEDDNCPCPDHAAQRMDRHLSRIYDNFS